MRHEAVSCPRCAAEASRARFSWTCVLDGEVVVEAPRWALDSVRLTTHHDDRTLAPLHFFRPRTQTFEKSGGEGGDDGPAAQK